MAAEDRIRSACVVMWCCQEPSPDAAERLAIAFHLAQRAGRPPERA